MGDLNFRVAELDAENQELHDENDRLVKQNRRLVEAVESYMGKFGDCGPVYENARSLLTELKGE